MSQLRICPNCRTTVPADAPEGVCPACALRAALETQEADESPTLTDPTRRPPPLPIEELARRLPELDAFELIGQGGMGIVYGARHRRLDRPVAVKVLDTDLSDDASFGERFVREARTLAQLDHANVVKVYDFGHREGLYYLMMELVDGVTLRETVEAGGLEPHEALALVPDICSALQYAHDQGVVHRDIKPENILVNRAGCVKIADFGLAKLVKGETEQRLTRTRQIMGTPNYMAPEQIEQPDEVDHRADIFALGVVFYELLTGELPIGRFPLPSKMVQVDVRLDDVVLRTLEKEPNLRYQQARELRTDLELLATGEHPAAPLPNDDEERSEASHAYEYRSAKTIFGLPLVHIAFSRDPEGKRMSLASGIIAIGDMAIGAVAIGGFSFGGITFGGITCGLVSFGGLVLGLLAALGGVGFGSFATGGFAVGVLANGALDIGLLTPTGAALARATFLGWLISTAGFTIGIVAAIYAWMQAVEAKQKGQPSA